MRNKTVIGSIIAAGIVVIIGIILFVALGNPKVGVDGYVSASAISLNTETNEAIQKELTAEDTDRLFAILDGKETTRCTDTSSYDLNKSFVLDGVDGEEMFCLAKDGTSNVLVYNQSAYITLSDAEWETVNSLYNKYAR